MKKIVIIVALFIGSIAFSQQKNVQLEEVNGLVKATYLFNNGNIEQQGFFKDGKLDGIWTSYDESGNKKSVAEYKEGVKVGKWFFWNGNNLSEVDFSRNTIADVKKWNKESIADKN